MIRVNGVEIVSFIFSGGEVSVRVPEIHAVLKHEPLLVSAYLHCSDDIMKLLMTVNSIRSMDGGEECRIILLIPYFPYARQDRVCEKGEAFALLEMCKLINSLKCAQVIVSDPHSSVIEKYLKNISVVPAFSHLRAECFDVWRDIEDGRLSIMSPDAGASKKIKNFREANPDLKFLSASKKRNKWDGFITDVYCNEDVKGLDIIIVDDICDGGATFVLLAQLLKEKGAGELYLYITHGIFSRGVEQVAKHFKKIICPYFFPGKREEYLNYENTRAACN